MANIWKKFESLLPKPAKFLATVVETNGNRSKVKLRNGVEIWVNGASIAVGNIAWIVDNQISGEGTDLDIIQIEI